MASGYIRKQLNTNLRGFQNTCGTVREKPFRMTRKEMHGGPQHGWRTSVFKSECHKYQELMMICSNVPVELLGSEGAGGRGRGVELKAFLGSDIRSWYRCWILLKYVSSHINNYKINRVEPSGPVQHRRRICICLLPLRCTGFSFLMKMWRRTKYDMCEANVLHISVRSSSLIYTTVWSGT